MKRLSQEEFLSRCRKVWGEKFDLSRAVYINSRTKVEIVCRKHGSFFITPSNFLSGFGCRDCGYEKNGMQSRLTKDEFIRKSRMIHGDKYDYSNVQYDKSNKKVDITCPEHGVFRQTPSSHLMGHGCPQCARIANAQKAFSNTQEFIEKAKAIHGEIYDYSLVEYKFAHAPVTIICSKHGAFRQSPNCHLNGHGCPHCDSSKGELIICEYLVNRGLEFETQKRFKGCRYKKPLPFDFYIESINTCIEFQGEQHYIQNKFFNTGGGFSGLQHRDQIKRDYCSANGINLIEIRYDENIEEKLNQYLQ